MVNIIEILQKLGYENKTNISVENNVKLKKLVKMDKKEILKALREGIEFEQRINSKISFYNTLDLIDYVNINNNKFEILLGVKFNKNIYDAIIVINEIPIAIIEYGEDVDRCCLHLQKEISNINETEELRTIQLLISIGQEDLKYKANDKNATWKKWDIPFKEDKEKIKEFLQKETLLNIIKNYIMYKNEKKEVATYYQYFATEKILKSKKEKNTIYLATGSGKTTTILFILNKLKEKARNTKIIIVVERLKLQYILKEEIQNSVKSRVEIADTKFELEEKINRVETDIIITTIQKIKSYNNEHMEKVYIIADISTSYSVQVLNRVKDECFKNSILTQLTNRRGIEEQYDYYYSVEQAIEDNTMTKLLYLDKHTSKLQKVEETAKDIINDFNTNYKEGKKAIIITQKSDCIKYVEEIQEIQKQYAIETISSTLEEIQEKEFLEDIIRENGNIQNYIDDNVESFNNGTLEILVISSLEELREITTSKVEVIYLTNEVSKNMLPTIFKIISKKENGKERGLIVDYSENKEELMNYAKKEQTQNLLPEIKDMLHDTRQISINLYIMYNNIKDKLCKIEELDSKNILIELELFLNKVIKLLEETAFIFSSDYILSLLKKEEIQEQESCKDRIESHLKLIDKIMVITAQEIKEKQLIEEYCSIIKINSFKFTKIEKQDIINYPNLEGIWTDLTEVQKAIAIKNRLKIYVQTKFKIKEKLEEVEQKYKSKEISDHQFLEEIEEIRLQYINEVKDKQIPDIIKKETFTINLYNYIENIKFKEKMQFTSEDKKINLIIEIMNKIKEKVKVGWKDNYYLWKEIELKIIESIYDSMQKNEIYISEETLDKILEKIKEIAYETLDYSTDIIKNNLYYIKKKNAYAVLQITDENSYWILENSTTVEGFSKHIADNYIKQAKELRKQGIIVNNQFVKKYKFPSLSAAANIILGRSSNGRIEWKDKDGKTFAQNEEEENGKTIKGIYTI